MFKTFSSACVGNINSVFIDNIKKYVFIFPGQIFEQYLEHGCLPHDCNTGKAIILHKTGEKRSSDKV